MSNEMFKRSLSKVVAHAMKQCHPVDNAGKPLQGKTGQLPLEHLVRQIMVEHGLTVAIPTAPTFSRWKNAAWTRMVNMDNVAVFAIAAQIYPAEKTLQFNLADLGEKQRLLRVAGQHCYEYLSQEGAADEWLASDAAKTWMDGLPQREGEAPPTRTATDPSNIDMSIFNDDDLLELVQAATREFHRRMATVHMKDKASEPHAGGKLLKALIDANERTFESICQKFQSLVEGFTEEDLRQILTNKDRKLTQQECYVAAILVGKSAEWLTRQGACE